MRALSSPTRRHVIRASACRAFLTSAMLLLAAACGRDNPPDPVSPRGTTYSLSPSPLVLQIGQSDWLRATADNGTIGAVTWSSSNPAVATVDQTGRVTALGLGQSEVRIASTSDPTQSATAQVRVEPAPCTSARGTILSGTSQSGVLTANSCVSQQGRRFDTWTLVVSATAAFTIDLRSNDFDAFLSLIRDGSIVATDDDGGGVTNARISATLSAGSYQILATSFDAGEMGTYLLSVSAPGTGGTPITVTVSPSSSSVQAGASVPLTATVTGTSDPRVSWSTSDATIASVSPVGVVQGIRAGTAIISATSMADPSRSGSATVLVGSAPPATTELLITNSLLNPINISVNGTVVGSVPANETRRTTVQRSGSLNVAWDLVRTRTTSGVEVGDVLGGVFDPISNPGATVSLTVDTRIGDQFIFSPVIVNNTSTTLLMGVNEGLQSQSRCNCTVPGLSSGTRIGYYKLFSNSNVRAYRSGSGYTGSYIFWSNFSALTNQSTGSITFNATFPPIAAPGLVQTPTAPTLGDVIEQAVHSQIAAMGDRVPNAQAGGPRSLVTDRPRHP